MKHLILAAGDAKRWPYSFPKQLAPLPHQGTPLGWLLQRIRRRFGNLADTCVVTHLYDIQAFCRAYGVQAFVPAHRRRLTQTILSTQDLWGEHTAILLGDVIYLSQESFCRVASPQADLRFYGTKDELFGVTFASSQQERLLEALNRAESPRAGKLWHVQRAAKGVPLQEHRPLGIEYISDGSDDIDNDLEYKQMCRLLATRPKKSLLW